jgi:hypothetical protein
MRKSNAQRIEIGVIAAHHDIRSSAVCAIGKQRLLDVMLGCMNDSKTLLEGHPDPVLFCV